MFSIVDVSDLIDPPSFPTGRIAILGEGTGLLSPGQPHQVVASQSTITALLQPSDLRTAALMAIYPSGQLEGTPELWLCPVNPATQAVLALLSGTATTLLTLTSVGYGAKYNDITVSYTTATKILELQLDTVGEAYAVGSGASAIADLVATINAQSNLVTALFAAEGTLAEISDTPMATASDGTVTDQHYTDALGQLKAHDLQLVVVLSSAATVHALLAAHVKETGTRGFFGYEVADLSWGVYTNRETNIAALKADRQLSVAAAGEPRMMTPGIGGTFQSVAYPSRLTCAMWAGAAALVPPTKPLTNIALNLDALEVELNDAEIGDMIVSGFSVPMRNHGPGRQGFVISHQRTTWVSDENLSRVEFSVGRGIDAIQRAVVEELWQFVGQEGIAAMAGRAAFVTNKLLNRAASGLDVLRIVTFNPRATRGELLGTILRVFFEYTPILPINFVVAVAKLRRTSIIAQISESFDISLSGLGGSISQQTPV